MFDDGLHTYLIEPLQQTHPVVSYSHVIAAGGWGGRMGRASAEEHANEAADRAGRPAKKKKRKRIWKKEQ